LNDEVKEVFTPLASRWARLGAVLIDMIFVSIVTLPVAYFAGGFDGLSKTPPQQPPTIYTISITLFNIFVYGLINWSLLKSRGQTIGKYALDIKIIHINGSLLKPEHIILKRYLPFVLIPIIPIIGGVISIIGNLLIFGEEKRCLHDRIALTRVVKI
jgi:uncharacterized RDD family membrane protein YckC